MAKELRTTLQTSVNLYINKSKDKGKTVEGNTIADTLKLLRGWNEFMKNADNDSGDSGEDVSELLDDGTLFSNLPKLTTTPPKLIVPVSDNLRKDHHTNTASDRVDVSGDVMMKEWANTPWSSDDMEWLPASELFGLVDQIYKEQKDPEYRRMQKGVSLRMSIKVKL